MTCKSDSEIIIFLHQGTSKKQLISNVDWLKGEFKSKKRDVGFVGETLEVVDYALHLLTEDLVKTS